MITKTPLAIGLGLCAGFLLAQAASLGTPSALADGGTRKWEHFCFVKSASVDELNKDANTTGKAGWELVSAAPSGASSTMMCFKRAAP